MIASRRGNRLPRWLAILPLGYLAVLLVAPVLRLLAEAFGSGDLAGDAPLGETAEQVSPEQKRGLRHAGLVVVALVLLWTWLTIGPYAPLIDTAAPHTERQTARLMQVPPPPRTVAALPPTFAGLYRTRYEPMVRLAYVLVDTSEDAEQVVQDAFVGLYQSANHRCCYFWIEVLVFRKEFYFFFG